MSFEELVEAAVERAVARAFAKHAQATPLPELLDYPAAAEVAKVTPTTIAQWVKRGLLNRYGSERHPRVRLDELLRVKPKPSGGKAEDIVERIFARRKL